MKNNIFFQETRYVTLQKDIGVITWGESMNKKLI